MSTASAAPAAPRSHGVAYTLSPPSPDQIKMDEIAQAQKMEMQLLKYDKDGCLMIQ